MYRKFCSCAKFQREMRSVALSSCARLHSLPQSQQSTELIRAQTFVLFFSSSGALNCALLRLRQCCDDSKCTLGITSTCNLSHSHYFRPNLISLTLSLSHLFWPSAPRRTPSGAAARHKSGNARLSVITVIL